MASTDQPVYMKIVVCLREGILTGKYADNKVPQASVLARRFFTSKSTVSHAYGTLESDGLIARYANRPPLIVARAQPFEPDPRLIEASTPDGRKWFCTQCWAYVRFTGPGTTHVC
jgi:DNA-binding transcriptional regulator YhcF (GntR family)